MICQYSTMLVLLFCIQAMGVQFLLLAPSEYSLLGPSLRRLMDKALVYETRYGGSSPPEDAKILL